MVVLTQTLNVFSLFDLREGLSTSVPAFLMKPVTNPMKQCAQRHLNQGNSNLVQIPGDIVRQPVNQKNQLMGQPH